MARDHGFHEARIVRVVDETPDTRTYVLDVPDVPFGYRAGQFVTFRIAGTMRSYSMSSSPDTDVELMTTVKRVPGGLVSNWMHDNLAAGDLVEVTLPTGVFCLRETDAPLVAFAGGSGITPVISLAKSALATSERTVRLLVANRDAESVIFRAALDELAGRYPGRLEVRHHLDTVSGLVTKAEILDFTGSAADDAADFYLCGPTEFMQSLYDGLRALNVADDRIHAEAFGPSSFKRSVSADRGARAKPANAAAEQPAPVMFVKSGKEARWTPGGGSLLELAEERGLSPEFSCRGGSCGTCRTRIVQGAVAYLQTPSFDVPDNEALICCSVPAATTEENKDALQLDL